MIAADFTYDGTTVTCTFVVDDAATTYTLKTTASGDPFQTGGTYTLASSHSLSLTTADIESDNSLSAGDVVQVSLVNDLLNNRVAGCIIVLGTPGINADAGSFTVTYDGAAGLSCAIDSGAQSHTYFISSSDPASSLSTDGGPGSTIVITDVGGLSSGDIFEVRVAEDPSGVEHAVFYFAYGTPAVETGTPGGGATSAGVDVAFGSDSLDPTPSFTRIDDPEGINVVTAWRTRRGRSYMTDRTDAGTASINFIDTAGNLDPTNSAGPFYPMDPNCPLRIQLFHPISETAHTIYTGLVQQVPQTLDLSENYITGTVEAVDLFSLLAISEIPPGLDFDNTSAGTSTANTVGETTYAAADVQDRIKAVLADAGIPSGLTNIFTGNVNVQETIYPPATQSLSVLQDAADAEFPGVANLFISKTGIVTFHGRLARFNPTNPDYNLTTWNVGDVAAVTAHPTWSLISGLTFDRDVAKVINASSMSPDGIDTPSTVAGVSDLPGQLSVDTGSITQYGNRVYSAANLVTLEGKTDGRDSLEETKLFADYYTANFHDAQTRIEQLTIRSLPADAPHAEQVWDILCGVEISDVVNVTTTHPGGGGFSAAPYFVEGISYEATNQGGAAFQDVTMTLDLSPAAYFATVSHLDGT